MSNKFYNDINTKNPLGTGGALSNVYYELLLSMFSPANDRVAPWAFKRVLNKFANQFVGYQQHDAHELLSYVLSGLHEDLNKVKEKPYVDKPED